MILLGIADGMGVGRVDWGSGFVGGDWGVESGTGRDGENRLDCENGCLAGWLLEGFRCEFSPS